MSLPWPYRRIATEEAFSIPEVYQAMPGVQTFSPPEAAALARLNTAITTSGMNWAPVLRFGIEAVGADAIMFAIDYPYQTTEAAVRFLDEAEISDEDKRKIYHQNAERIFGIAASGDSREPG